MQQIFLNKKNLLKIFIAIILIGINVLVFFLVQNHFKNKGKGDVVSINMMLIDKNSVVIFDEIKEAKNNECVYDILIKYHDVRAMDSIHGKVIFDIDTVKTKFYTESYIAIYVNDVYSNMGISYIYASEGLKITFKEVSL